MPRLIPLEQVSTIGSLTTGLAQGLLQGTREQQMLDRRERIRRGLRQEQIQREDAVYARSRADHLTDQQTALTNQRTLAQEADARIIARQAADDERAAKARLLQVENDRQEAGRLAGLLGYAPAPQLDTEMGPPATPPGPETYGPPTTPTRPQDPGFGKVSTLEAYDRIQGRKRADEKAAVDDRLARDRFDEDKRHHQAMEARGGDGSKAAVDQADAEISFLRQKLGQWQQDFKDAQAEIRDRGEATPDLAGKLEKARAAWNRTNAEIKAKLAQRGAATRQYPADVTTEAERREYDALLGRE